MRIDDIMLLAVPAFGTVLAIVLFVLGVILIRREGRRPRRDAEEEPPDETLEGESEGLEAESVSPSEEPEEEAGLPATDEEEPARGEIPVASLVRDEQTGKLILEVGDQRYKSPADISNSDEMARLKLAASELISWFSAEEEAAADRPRRIRPVPMPFPEERSMIEELNDILERNAEQAGEEAPSFRLIEGASGEVRVLVGLNTYKLDEVPLPAIRDLIEAAVKEWEGNL